MKVLGRARMVSDESLGVFWCRKNHPLYASLIPLIRGSKSGIQGVTFFLFLKNAVKRIAGFTLLANVSLTFIATFNSAQAMVAPPSLYAYELVFRLFSLFAEKF